MRRLLIKAFALWAVFWSVSAFSQATPYQFVTLKSIDQISDAEYQNKLGSPDVKSNTFLVSKWKDQTGREQLALFKKFGENWNIYSIFGLQTTDNVKLTEDEQYLTYVTSAKTMGEGQSESHAYFCIVDIVHQKQMPILQQTNNETWNVVDQNQVGKKVSQVGCSAQIVFLGKGNLTSVYTASNDFSPKNFSEDCLPKGQYKIQDDVLVKIK